VALTGGIGTGKSHVRAAFENLGVPTIDSDLLSRQAIAHGTAGFAAVVDRFGPEVLDADGGLDRQKLAAIVFTDAEARKALEGIIHPHVSRATDQWFASLNAGKHAFAIADVPLLYEVGRDKDFDTVIVAAASPAAQLRRVIDRGLSETEARLRITAQLPIEDKIRRADYVIRTDSTFVETDAQVRKVWETLRSQSTETQLG